MALIKNDPHGPQINKTGPKWAQVDVNSWDQTAQGPRPCMGPMELGSCIRPMEPGSCIGPMDGQARLGGQAPLVGPLGGPLRRALKVGPPVGLCRLQTASFDIVGGSSHWINAL